MVATNRRERGTEIARSTPFYGHLYVQIVAAIVLGGAIGYFWPDIGAGLKPLGDAFVKLVKMVIGPVVFFTIVNGIAGVSDLGEVRRIALKALAYFIAMSTFALIVGLVVANTLRPGAGMHIDPATLTSLEVSGYVQKAHDQSVVGFLLNIIPTTLGSAFVDGDILQVLLVAVLLGIALTLAGEAGRPVLILFESVSAVIFRLVGIIMRLAPIGAFGAFAFTIGKYGIGAIVNLAALVATFYVTALFFVIVVLGLVAWANGFSILKLIAYLKAELILVLGTSSSEAALPSLLGKMERAGCPKAIVGLVVPTGYSFNLDGTNIYMTLAALFIAQATDTALSWEQQAVLFGVAILSSKGAAGVTGAGFISLAATLSVVPSVPIAGMALILGIDRFMSECRALTNFVGNAVATIVVSRWEGALDKAALEAALGGESAVATTVEPVT